MSDETSETPERGGIPATGLYFDRHDVDGEIHRRTYYRDGERVFDAVAKLDPDRPGRWQVAVRWLRRGRWLTHGWGQLADESAAMGLLDAAGIGVEALTDGAVFLGHAQPIAAPGPVPPEVKTAPRTSAGETCRAKGWGPGTLLMSGRWQAPKPIQAIDPSGAVTLNGPGGRYHVQTFPADVHEVTV